MIPVSVGTRSGAWLRASARKMAAQLLRRAGASDDDNVGGYSSARKVVEGFIVSAVRMGAKARGRVIDPPGTVGLMRDAFNVWGDVTGSVPGYELVAITSPRDNYAPRFELDIPELDEPLPAVTAWWENRYSKDLVLEAGYDIELVGGWCFPPTESPAGIARARINTLNPVPVGLAYGAPDDDVYFLELSHRSGYPRRAQRVQIAESYIASKTGGFRLPQRAYAGNGAELFATVNLPQIPMAQCYWDSFDRFVIAAVAVSKSAQPSNPEVWREDAGSGGVLVIKIAFDEDGDPYWAWHHLLDFSTASEPELLAEQWLPDWQAIQVPGEPPIYPVTVSGHTQNAVRSLCCAGMDGPADAEGGEFSVFFTTMHGRQVADTGGVQLVQQHTLCSLRVTNTSGAAPAVMQTVILRDVSAGSASAAYSAYGNGDAAIARSWTLRGCEYLMGEPRAVASSLPLQRPADNSMYWLANDLYNTGAYVSAEPVSEIVVLSASEVLLSSPAAVAGASFLYRWSASVATTPRTIPLRFVKHTTKVAGGRMLLSAYKYPDANDYPDFRVLSYDAVSNTLSPLLSVPARNFGAWFAGAPPPLAIACYQQEVKDDSAAVVTPFCITLSYWNLRNPAPPAVIDQYTLLSIDGGLTVSKHLLKHGGAHGAFYLGSTTWQPTYTQIFGAEA